MVEIVKSMTAAAKDTKAITPKSVGIAIENNFVKTSCNSVDQVCGCDSAKTHADELLGKKNPVDETVSLSEKGGRRESRNHHRQDSYTIKSDDDGGRTEAKSTHHRQDSNATNPAAPPRLLVVSNKIKSSVFMQAAALPNVSVVQYKYESVTLEALLAAIAQQLGRKKVESIALAFNVSGVVLCISGKDDKVVSKESMEEDACVREFFNQLMSHHLDERCSSRRLDLLACGNVAQGASGAAIVQQLETLLGVPVGISKDLVGREVMWLGQPNEENTKITCVSHFYFHVDRLCNWNRSSQQTLAGFEKIRTVGKGAYGTAVLYRKKDDDSLVILKEINLHDLSASERNMALNEVNVLALMDHPNIISYYDSFEEDGTVVIEMEYADGGTLSQYLSEQTEPLEEREVLSMFQQMVAAIKYVHQHNILHRDLKTANIFLTKEGVVKIGDFGISKLMSTTNPAASTVLGTPFYISPEMCEGKSYKDKSDIWALGCILYELVCRQKTFDGSNLPAVVNKIMKGQFAPVKGSYTSELKDLIESMLQQSPNDRPSASELWDLLPKLLAKYEDPQSDCEEDPLTSSDNTIGRKRRARSVLYYYDMISKDLTPIRLPSRLKIRDVAVGYNFVIAVSNERMVYTWGEGGSGQLGHGTLDCHPHPEVVQALKGKSIIRACCGDGFSIFASDNGIVMTCGDGSTGCLGHGDWTSASKPRLIETLLSVDIRSIACGPHHVVAVGSERDVYSWGQATDGCLGQGHVENQCVPVKVAVPDPVQSCYCGKDGSMLLTEVGTILACGNNEYNKLGLNQRQGFLMAMKNIFNKTVSGEKTFTLVKTLVHHQVISVSMGAHHTAVVIKTGHVYMMGRNSEAQLGLGNTKQVNAPMEVKFFHDRLAFQVRCGEYFTVAATSSKNDVLFWGTSSASTEDVNSCRSGNTTSTNLCGIGDVCLDNDHSVHCGGAVLTGSACEGTSGGGAAKIALECEGFNTGGCRRNPETGEGSPCKGSAAVSPVLGADRDAFSDSTSNATAEKTAATVAAAAAAAATVTAAGSGFNPLSSNRVQSAGPGKAKDADKGGGEVILQPTAPFRLDSSGSLNKMGDKVTLSNIFCQGQHFFIQVETTGPPQKRKSRRKRCFRKRFNCERFEGNQRQTRMSASSREGGDEYSSETSELDSRSMLPLWLKQELADSEAVNDGNETDATSGEESSAVASKSSMGSIQIDVHLKQDEGSRRQGTLGSSRSDYPKDSKEKSPMDCVDKVPKTKLKTSQPEMTTGHENNIPGLPGDPLSSSSSSEAMTIALLTEKEEKAVAIKKSLVGPVKRVPPVPYRTKAGPAPSLKPQHRLRSQGKTRRSDSGKETPSVSQRGSGELEKMQMELERLKVEKEKTELRLKHLEKDKEKERERIRREAERKAKEHEIELKREIEHLRSELHEQSHQLHDNYNVVRSMQEQLAKVQTEQTRLQSQEQTLSSSSRQATPVTSPPAPRESRICTLQ